MAKKPTAPKASKAKAGKPTKSKGTRAKAKPTLEALGFELPPPVTVIGPSLKKVRAAFELYAPMLRGLNGVVRVSYGAKWSKETDGYGFEKAGHDAAPTVRYAILVYVRDKPTAPMDPTADGFIPPHIGGIPTDVIGEPQVAKLQANRVVLTNGNATVTGALGVVVVDTSNPPPAPLSYYALTNAHVACGPTLQPPPTTQLQVFGQTDGASVPVNAVLPVRSGFFPAGPVNLDAAAVPLDAATAKPLFQRIPMFNTAVVATPFDDTNPSHQTVMMFSRVANAVIFGRVVESQFVADIDMGGGQSQLLAGLLKIRSVDINGVDSVAPFGVAGDSGSVIVIRVGQKFRGIGLYLGTQAADAANNGLAHPEIAFAHWLLRENSSGGIDPNCVLKRLKVSF